MKWIVIVCGGCIILYCLTKLRFLRTVSRWLISAKYRKTRKHLRELTNTRKYLQGELNRIIDEIRMYQ